jgi:cobalt-zinc-cadmium efflux system membrane fusion protein
MMNRKTLSRIGLAALLAWGLTACAGEETDTAQIAEKRAADTCVEHQIAKSRCPFCNPSLIEELGPCVEHGVPEALCYQCHPELNAAFQAAGDWCAGHDRPESQCYICNPELDPALANTDLPQDGELPADGGRPGWEVTRLSETTPDADSPGPPGTPSDSLLPATEIPRRLRAPSVHCATEDLIVRLDSPEVARDAGLGYARAEERPVTRVLECNAVLAYDGDRYARLSSQVPGVVSAVHHDLGDRVERGEPLATVTSSRLGAAKAAYLEAAAGVSLWERNHARETDLLERGVSTERDLLEAEAGLTESRIALSSAKQTLLSLGLSEREVETLAKTGDTSTRYVLDAPFAGVVVERPAASGEVVDPSRTLFAVADVSTMWALLDVYESDAREVGVGQPVVLRVEGLRGEAFAGEITWVSAEVDRRTRTLRARAEIANPQGALKANMFAEAEVAVRDRHPAVVVPEEAVQWEGCCNVVFIRRSDQLYEPRKVRLGSFTGAVYEVLSGLEAGEVVVTRGSFLLKTEILKGNIGAGCCEVRPGA